VASAIGPGHCFFSLQVAIERDLMPVGTKDALCCVMVEKSTLKAVELTAGQLRIYNLSVLKRITNRLGQIGKQNGQRCRIY
jgi:hypothetical protein